MNRADALEILGRRGCFGSKTERRKRYQLEQTAVGVLREIDAAVSNMAATGYFYHYPKDGAWGKAGSMYLMQTAPFSDRAAILGGSSFPIFLYTYPRVLPVT